MQFDYDNIDYYHSTRYLLHQKAFMDKKSTVMSINAFEKMTQHCYFALFSAPTYNNATWSEMVRVLKASLCLDGFSPDMTFSADFAVQLGLDKSSYIHKLIYTYTDL